MWKLAPEAAPFTRLPLCNIEKLKTLLNRLEKLSCNDHPAAGRPNWPNEPRLIAINRGLSR